MTNPDWLDEVEAREQKATKGPWGLGGRDPILQGVPIVSEATKGIVLCCHPAMGPLLADGLFVVHARTDVPRLCKEVKELRSVIRGKTFPTESAEVRSWMMPRRAIR